MAKKTARHFLAVELDVPTDEQYETYATITNRANFTDPLFNTTTISGNRFDQLSARTIISSIRDAVSSIRSYSDQAVTRVQEQVNQVMMRMTQGGD